MKVESKKFGDTGAIVLVSGEIDLYSSTDLWKILASAIESGSKNIILELTKLEYLDSSGVGVIINLVQTLKRKQGRLLVCGLHGMPRKVLEMSNIISILQLCDSQEQGIAMFAAKTN